jgi:hypothetical protein
MNKSHIKFLLVVFIFLLGAKGLLAQNSAFNSSVSNKATPLNTNEIREYFDLRDSLVLINNEMKKILMGSLREDFFGDDVEKNLNGCMLFLEQRIEEFSAKNSQMQYHYLKKLRDLFSESTKLHPLVMSKVYVSKLEKLQNQDLDILEASVLKNAQTETGDEKLWHKPYFEPIDVRTLAAVSKGKEKSLKPYEFAAQARLSAPDTTEKTLVAQLPKADLEPTQLQEPKQENIKQEEIKEKEIKQKEPQKTKPEPVMEPKETASKALAETKMATEPKPVTEPAAKIVTEPRTATEPAVAKIVIEPRPATEPKTQLAKLLEESAQKPSLPLTSPQKPQTLGAPSTAASASGTSAGAATTSAAAKAIFSDLKQKIDLAAESVTKVEKEVKPVKKVAKPMIFDESFKHPRPLAIMIENHSLARPQTGLNEASIVYEIPVEGGITRFMGIYEKAPKVAGPVRSCREYFVDRALEVDALYVHCGGSPKGYAYIASSHIFALDELRKGKGFFRDKSRKAPHNLYARGQGVVESAGEQFPMKLKEPMKLLSYGQQEKLGSSKINSVDIRYHQDYSVGIKFEEGVYRRYMNKKLHLDKDTKKPLDAAVVIIQKAAMKTVDKVGRQEINFIGQGDGWIMERGRLTLITWHKEAPEARTKYLDMNNDEYVFPKDKRVWVQVVSPNLRIDFKD